MRDDEVLAHVDATAYGVSALGSREAWAFGTICAGVLSALYERATPPGSWGPPSALSEVISDVWACVVAGVPIASDVAARCAGAMPGEEDYEVPGFHVARYSSNAVSDFVQNVADGARAGIEFIAYRCISSLELLEDDIDLRRMDALVEREVRRQQDLLEEIEADAPDLEQLRRESSGYDLFDGEPIRW